MRPLTSRLVPAPSSSSAAHVGAMLREWRAMRRVSQLVLALEVGVSSRHLSYVETGKARASRELITRLADALRMPLRDRNAVLTAAGFAPAYRETNLTAPMMAQVQQAVQFILEQQEPYPAYVVNRRWDLITSNRAAKRVFTLIRGRSSAHTNVMRQIFDPADIRAAVVNWEEVAGDLVRHLHDEVAASPADDSIRALLDEVLRSPGVPARWRTRELDVPPAPLLTTIYRTGGRDLRFFSTITTFGTPRDVTIDELRIECVFPGDEATAELCRTLARDGA